MKALVIICILCVVGIGIYQAMSEVVTTIKNKERFTRKHFWQRLIALLIVIVFALCVMIIMILQV